MRRILLASCVALLPGLAFAQSSDKASPPGPGHFGWEANHHHVWSPEQMLMKFYAANTTHDGHLTLAQAKAADFKPVVAHFSQIDTAHHGYVTFYDIQAWRLDELASHLQARANALRAKD